MKIYLRFFTMLFSAFALAFGVTGIQPTPAQANNPIIYVKANAVGADNGSDWTNAYRYLQDALATASGGEHIWVAAGVYHPDEGGGQINDERYSTFMLKDSVEIYGGFAGTETQLNQRNIAANPTILSGDIDKNDVNTDGNFIAETTADIAGSNAYHVVRAGGTVTPASILDGFIITAGSADGGAFDASGGGGIFNWNASPTLRNITFSGNYGTNGGGMYNYNGAAPSITNAVFSGNRATSGGGMYNSLASSNLTNATFTNNTATLSGGGIGNTSTSIVTLINVTVHNNSATINGGGINSSSSSTVMLTNVTISGNSATTNGGGLYLSNSTATMKNTLIANSVSGGDCRETGSAIGAGSVNNLIKGTGTNACGLTDGANGNIIGLDPKLGALADNGGPVRTMSLGSDSPALNTGTNTGCPATDARGVSRPQGASCDIGAYEKSLTFADVPFNGFAWAQIESVYAAGITGGCATSPLNYCPNNSVTRSQMAIFLLRGKHGSSFSPPAPDGIIFGDVPSTAFAAAWIEQLAAEGITGGCGGGNYCPNNTVTRSQMAIFLLRAKYGSSYTPPSATGTAFNDVPSNAFAAAWIEQLVAEGITGGCGGGNYCPNNPVTRSQMAIFLQRTFNLPLP